jgi:hypothetical protein
MLMAQQSLMCWSGWPAKTGLGLYTDPGLYTVLLHAVPVLLSSPYTMPANRYNCIHTLQGSLSIPLAVAKQQVAGTDTCRTHSNQSSARLNCSCCQVFALPEYAVSIARLSSLPAGVAGHASCCGHYRQAAAADTCRTHSNDSSA